MQHCKKSPSRDVADQTISSLEYVSLIKPVVFPDIPFPSPEFSQNPFESFSVHVRRQEQNELRTRARKGYTIWVYGSGLIPTGCDFFMTFYF
jgi:hypothetical protein